MQLAAVARNGDGGEPHDDGQVAVAVPSRCAGASVSDVLVAASHRALLVAGNYMLLGRLWTHPARPTCTNHMQKSTQDHELIQSSTPATLFFFFGCNLTCIRPSSCDASGPYLVSKAWST